MLIIAWAGGCAQASNLTDGTYFPGYISYQVPLSLFAPARMAPACAMLQRGELDKAEHVFALETHQHPEDLAAYVGFLQAAQGHRDAYLSQYQQDVRAEDSAANEFKLGMLAYYIRAEQASGTNQGKTLDGRDLAQIALKGLSRAYQLSHDPVAGFAYEDVLSYYGGGDGLRTWEDMMRRLGGLQIYRTYSYAKTHNWNGPQPSIPQLDGKDLTIFRYIVGSINFAFGEQVGITGSKSINGTTHIYVKSWSPVSAEHQAAMNYLGPWRQRLINAVSTAKHD